MPQPQTAQPTSAPSKPFWLLMAIPALVFVVGLLLGSALGKKLSFNQGYQAGFDAAKQKVVMSGVFPKAAATLSLNGVIKEAGNKLITIDVPQLVIDPFEQPAPTLRRVSITPTTEISLLIAKTPEEMNKDQAAFSAEQTKFAEEIAKGNTTAKPPAPPAPFEAKTAKVSDLKIGMFVTVTAAADVLRAESFDATKVSANMSVAGTAPTAPPPAASAPSPAK